MAKQYAVAHVSKGKGASTGLTRHIDRETTPKNADPHKASLNTVEDYSHLGKTLGARADKVIEEAGVKRKVQADAVKYCPILLSGSHEQMKHLEETGGLDSWYRDTKKFAEERYGRENIISFAMHCDEKTPHVHCVVVPIIRDRDKKGNDRARLSARDKFNKSELEALQDDYAKAMKGYDLQRGVRNSRAKHTTVLQYYKQLPDKIKALEADVRERQSELAKLKAQYAQYSAGKGLKMVAEGAGAGLKELMSGGKKKRESLEAKNEQLKELLEKKEQEYKAVEHLITKGFSADRAQERALSEQKQKLVKSFAEWTNKLLKSCGVEDLRVRPVDGGKNIGTYDPTEIKRDRSKGMGM